MKRISTRLQRTLTSPAEVRGRGLLSGAEVILRFLPAPPSSGVVFVRSDLPGRPRVAASVTEVTGTQRRTTLGRGAAQVTLVEHALAALAGLRVDNCVVEVSGAEPPGLDGSARGFVEALLGAGVAAQPAERSVWAVEAALTVSAGGGTLTIHPPSGPRLSLTYFLDYGRGAAIGRQVATHGLAPGRFARELSACRTFVLEREAEELRRQGIGRHATAADLLIFGERGPIGNRLRFANEPARHKVLDMVGDLSLVGVDLCGHVVAYRSGHELNVELARRLHQELASAARAA